MQKRKQKFNFEWTTKDNGMKQNSVGIVHICIKESVYAFIDLKFYCKAVFMW